MNQAFLGIKDFASYSGLSESTIRRRIRDGSLPRRQLGGKGKRILIPAAALEMLEAAIARSLPFPPDDPAPSNSAISLPGRRPAWLRKAS